MLTSQNDINSKASCSDKKFSPQTFPEVRKRTIVTCTTFCTFKYKE